MAKKPDRLAATRAAAEKSKSIMPKDVPLETPYDNLDASARNAAMTRDAGLSTGRRQIPVAPVRDIDPSTHKPAPTTKGMPPVAQPKKVDVEGILRTARANSLAATPAKKPPSGAITGPAVKKAAPKLRNPSGVRSRMTPPMDARTSAPKPVVVRTQRTGKPAKPAPKLKPSATRPASRMTPRMAGNTAAEAFNRAPTPFENTPARVTQMKAAPGSAADMAFTGIKPKMAAAAPPRPPKMRGMSTGRIFGIGMAIQGIGNIANSYVANKDIEQRKEYLRQQEEYLRAQKKKK